ncbi:hypothetical protein COC47_05035 [Bacillus cereus]|uniref:hypothetical protein n=1 Tax=Bacillus cereus TaxID=1396 RepID=UPI000BFDB502|nr:hypothetical protein [Bacillus cereus]MEB9406949.1 hypothetical protein [Bacillus cereus]PGR42015.1 hypothetical protein COC47_05035 [Bacillus cereus]RCL17582.1 hypothetical protein BLO02_008000 [Bacillus cereus]
MQSISLDQYTGKIYHASTKEYFQEVMQSYINGSYRSATVMLYSVVICDLVYKLKELVERYEDDKAKKILEDIKRIREKDEKSPEWENKLVEFVHARTNLLEANDYANIEHLKKQRHLSAHPVLDQLDILFKPNKETVRAHMRNMLEGVFIKPPILSNEIFTSFVEDVASVKDTLVKEGTLERYLTTKYFNHINILLEKRIFKNLWKFIFNMDNPLCSENREINFIVLKIMLSRRGQELLEFIKEEAGHFSDIMNLEDVIEYLVELCSIYPSIYENLEEHARIVIANAVEYNNSLLIKAVFLNESIEEHFSLVDNRINDDSLYTLNQEEVIFLEQLADENACMEIFYKFMINNLASSKSFNSADVRFNNCIFPYLGKFKRQEFIWLFEAINTNNQVSGRRQALIDNEIIKEHAGKIFEEGFDYSNRYPNFTY